MPLDPLTALSLAGTICQFVDFSCKILTTTRHVYNSYDGDLTVNTELGLVTNEIQDLTAKLTRPIPSSGPLSPEEQQLKDLCVACDRVAVELIEKLDKLKARGRHQVWQSFQVAICSAWSRQDLNDLMRRLMMFKDAIESRIVLGLRYANQSRPSSDYLRNIRSQINHLSLQSSDRFDHLDRQTQDIIIALSNNQRALAADLQQQALALSQMLNRTEMVVSNAHNQNRKIIIDAIQAATYPSIPPEFYHPGIPKSLAAMKREEKDLKRDIEQKVLNSLAFPSMNDREDEVVEAYRTTFDWVFQNPDAHQHPWDSFVTWLRSGSGVYWINGKAGSGKSTLMRYIYNHHATQRELKSWAAASGLTASTGSFFFWNSGTKMQKSQVGLLRSLLYTALRERPELIPTVLPWLWAELYSQGIGLSRDLGEDQDEDQRDPSTGMRRRRVNHLTLEKLIQAFETFLTQPNRKMKLCLFIDGLDEYDGDVGEEGNYEALARLLTRISSFANVKVCISSRPLVVLQDAFRGLPTLKLQDLTSNDIRYYTQDNLQRNGRFKELVIREPQRTSTLIADIVASAEGVFLWVKLVVRSLLSGLSNGDSITILQRRLVELPKDLHDLYSHMLYSRINTFYMVKASEIFQMLQASKKQSDITGRIDEEPEPLTALTLSLADDEDLNLAVTAKIEPLTAAHVLSRCQVMEMQLLNWSAGLLEIQGTSIDDFGESRAKIATVKGKVQYMHRTVRDFIEHPETWKAIVGRTAHTGFSPNQCLLRSCVLQLKIISPNHLTKNIWRTVATAMAYAHKSEFETGISNTALLNELDKTMTHHAADRVDMNFHGHWASFPGTFWDKPAEWQDNFLSLAVQYCLCAFVSENLGYGDRVLRSKTGRPLLDYAVNPIPTEQRYPLAPQMVRLLLAHGAKPNKEFLASTPWENALAFVTYNSANITAKNGRQGYLLKWLEIFEILVDADANVNAVCAAGPVSALAVIDSVFMEHLPTEAANLRRTMKSKGAVNAISVFGKLTHWQKNKRKSREERKQ